MSLDEIQYSYGLEATLTQFPRSADPSEAKPAIAAAYRIEVVQTTTRYTSSGPILTVSKRLLLENAPNEERKRLHTLNGAELKMLWDGLTAAASENEREPDADKVSEILAKAPLKAADAPKRGRPAKDAG